MTEHTPAPWRRTEGELLSGTGKRVVLGRSCASFRLAHADDEEIANGRLADSAADLFEALVEARDLLARKHTTIAERISACGRASAAITKATQP